MNPVELIERVRRSDAELVVEGSRLVVQGYGDPLPEELWTALRDYKGEIMALLCAGPTTANNVAENERSPAPEIEASEQAEVTWRVEAMRPQVPLRGGIPFLVARRVPVEPGCCHSCGGPKPPGQLVRCGLCIRAATQVLDEMREGVALRSDPSP